MDPDQHVSINGSEMIRKSIAGVELLIRGASDLEIQERNPVDKIFAAPEHSASAEHQIHIEINDDPLPDVDNKRVLFHEDSAWSIRQDRHYFWIVFYSPSKTQPRWITRFDHSFSHGVVFYGDRVKDIHNGCLLLNNPVVYPLDQILLMHYLARIGGAIIHSAGWRIHDSGWIFAGKSGAGKSTISNLIVEETGAVFFSDDRIAVRKIGSEFLMYGTPWPGDAGYAVNESVPIKGIFFLNKGSENEIKKLKPSDAIARLMPIVSIPWYDREKVERMMDFCDTLIGSVPMVELTFVPGKEAVDMLTEFVR